MVGQKWIFSNHFRRGTINIPHIATRDQSLLQEIKGDRRSSVQNLFCNHTWEFIVYPELNDLHSGSDMKYIDEVRWTVHVSWHEPITTQGIRDESYGSGPDFCRYKKRRTPATLFEILLLINWNHWWWVLATWLTHLPAMEDPRLKIL